MLFQGISLKCDLEHCPWKVMKCAREESLDPQCYSEYYVLIEILLLFLKTILCD